MKPEDKSKPKKRETYDLPEYPLRQLLAQRVQLRKLTAGLVNRVFQKAELAQLITALQSKLRKGIARTTLAESLRSLVGTRVTGVQLDAACWRMLGNQKLLLNHKFVTPWRRQTHNEWVPVQVTNVRLTRGGRQGAELGHEFTFQVLAGTPCSLTIQQWWSYRKSRYMALRRDSQGPSGWGFSRQRSQRDDAVPPKYPYRDARQFLTLRCYVLIEPDLCDTEPNFYHLSFNSGTREWNREQQKYRAKVDPGYECPFDYTPAESCHLCPIGLDQCRAATHLQTYDFRSQPCPGCQQLEQPFDPARPNVKVCVQCAENKVLKGDA